MIVYANTHDNIFFSVQYSSHVIISYVSAEKGICISTVSLWILLVYTEASLRLKDLKTSHANLSHLFAAHWYVDIIQITLSAMKNFQIGFLT